MATEQARLDEARNNTERQWSKVREEYSEGGEAWNFFTHDHARSRVHGIRSLSKFRPAVGEQVGLVRGSRTSTLGP